MKKRKLPASLMPARPTWRAAPPKPSAPIIKPPSFLPYLGQIILSLISQFASRCRIRICLEQSSRLTPAFFPSRRPGLPRLVARRSF
ncbi:hypothetical protein BH09VER1_BH09VER1_01680 [soil metagenome]